MSTVPDVYSLPPLVLTKEITVGIVVDEISILSYFSTSGHFLTEPVSSHLPSTIHGKDDT